MRANHAILTKVPHPDIRRSKHYLGADLNGSLMVTRFAQNNLCHDLWPPRNMHSSIRLVTLVRWVELLKMFGCWNFSFNAAVDSVVLD